MSTPALCVGLAGGSGAGKSALAAALCDAFGRERVLVLPQDAYYRDRSALSAAERASLCFDHPDALELELLVAQLDALRAGQAIELPSYDFARHQRTPVTRRLEARELVVVDGILVLAVAELRARFDLCVFVEAAETVRFERRLARDVRERGRSPESVRAQFADTVQSMHAEFVEPSRDHAELVLANDSDFAGPRDRLVARVRALLQSRQKTE
jgi:uridine kinase